MEQTTSTDENTPKKEKKRLPKKQRIAIGIIMILVACATLILGIMIQIKGFDIFSNKASVGCDNIAYASSNDGAQVASVPNLPQGKNLFNENFLIANYVLKNGFYEIPVVYDVIFDIDFLPNTVYTFSFKGRKSNANTSCCLGINYINADPSYFDLFDNVQDFSFSSLPNRTISFFTVNYSTVADGDKILINPYTFQCEIGSVATAYEPNFESLYQLGYTDSKLDINYFPLYRGDVVSKLFINNNQLPNHLKLFGDLNNFNKNAVVTAVPGNPNIQTKLMFLISLFDNNVNDLRFSLSFVLINGSPRYFYSIDYICDSISTRILNTQFQDYYSQDYYIPSPLGPWQNLKSPLVFPNLTVTYDFSLTNQNCTNGIGTWLSKTPNFFLTAEMLKDNYNNGYTDGKKDGIFEADSNNQNFGNLIFGIVDAPFKVFRDAFNFEIFGINVSALILFFITILCVSLVIKKLI